MIRHRSCSIVLVLCGCMLGAATCLAQVNPGEGGMNGVIGTGAVTLDRQPNLLRLQMLTFAEGKDIKEALAKLKEKEAAAREKLQKLHASEASVSFSDAMAQEGSQQQQMDRMIQMRTGRAPKAAKNQPVVVTVSATLKAEWPLKAENGDDLLIEATELQSQIKAADLGGNKSAGPATPEQEEAAEEAQSMGNGDGQPNPRDPVFMYVRKISAEDRDKARASAFKKAHDDADRLARAAGCELGTIRLLASNAIPTYLSDQQAMFDGGFQQRAMYQMNNRQEETDDAGEAIGLQPGKVGYRITVYVSYAVK